MLKDIFEKQKQFSQNWFQNLPNLRTQLRNLETQLLAHEQAICAALKQDLNKSANEVVLTEYQIVLDEVRWFRKNFHRIYRHKQYFDPLWFLGHRSTTMREPYGCMAIFAPYNYPFNLSMVPLIGAIACSNTVILKPSKITPAINQVMKEIIEKVFPAEQCYVLSEAENNLPDLYDQLYQFDFDIVCFTGSENIGRQIYQNYAQKLIPVLLELGGKCPVVIDPSADLSLTARRIIWAKTMNNGQTCVSPDYLLVHKSQFTVLVEQLKLALKTQFPQSTDLVARMSSPRAVAKIEQLALNTDVIYEHRLNDHQTLRIIQIQDLEQPIMCQEIFGPLLPIVCYDNLADTVAIIQRNNHPLAMYIFTKNQATVRFLSQRIQSGAIVVNDLLIHLAKHTPFGGIKQSGVGQYHKWASVRSMTHEKPIIYSSKADVSFRYQPFNAKKLALLKKLMP